MGGDGHDRARAVVGEDVVGDPDGDALTVEGVDGEAAGGAALLLDRAEIAGGLSGLLLVDHRLDVRFEHCVSGGEGGGEGVLGGEGDEGCAVNGVDTGGEDFDLFVRAFDGEVDEGAFGAADPVALHGADLVGPAVHGVEAVEELIGILGDAKEPLGEVALLDDGVFVTPATTAYNLLVGEDGGALGAPVDLALFAIGEALLKHLEEEPLVPAIVVGEAGGDLVGPVV